MNRLLSVIIPVYNTEKYVEQCVKSVLEQPNSEDIEIILVDDGSKDNSGSVCDMLSKKDERVRVIHKENGGPSSARNCGIKDAKGEYVVFLDSDDYYTENTIKTVLEEIRNTPKDFYMFSVQSVRDNEVVGVFFDASKYNIDRCINGQQSLKSVLNYDYNYGWCSVWYVIRRSLLVKNNLLFPLGYLCEDVYFSFRLWLFSQNAKIIPVIMYNYRRDNQNSTTHIASFKFSNDLLEICRQNLEYAIEKIQDHELIDLLKLNIQTLVEVVIIYYSRYSTEERKKLKYLLHQLKDIYNLFDKNKAKPKEKLISFLIKIFGFRIVSYIWRLKLVFQ